MTKSQVSTLEATGTRRERVARREEAIIDAARDMFIEKGFGKTTIAEIARQSGVADGTVYLYFKNKDDVARAVLSKFYSDLTQTAQEGVDGLTTPPERLEFLARHHMQSVIDNWRVLEMMPLIDMTMENYEGSELHHLNKTYVAVFDRVAKDAQSQGFLNPAFSAAVLRDIFYGSMDYGARTIMFKRAIADIDLFVGSLMDMLLANSHSSKANETELTTRLEQAVRRLERLAGS